MPYASNGDLPENIRMMYPSEECQTAFRKAFNAASAEYHDDAASFGTAHKTAQECMSKRGTRPMMNRALPVQSEMEFRAAADGGWDFTGYAALFDTPSDTPRLPYSESIDPGAFNRTLKSGAHHSFVMNHDDNLILASTKTKRLHLSADTRGLLTEAKLPDTSYARDLRALHEAGETRGMSFEFKATKNGETWGYDGARPTRRLTDVSLGHVSVIATDALSTAYSATQQTIQFRALAQELSAEADDLEDLFDALREGRALDATAASLLDRLADHYHVPASPEVGQVIRTPAAWKAILTEKGLPA